MAQQAAPPSTIAVATYRLSDRVEDAFAAEKLSGNVLVPADATLFATSGAAVKDTRAVRGRAIAMSVVTDHGTVVELSTAAPDDCVSGWEQPYTLRVFVARDKLTPRAKADVVKTFSDGTALAIDRGAPVAISEKGLTWETLDIDDVIKPSEDQLVLSVPARTQPAALPPAPGDRLICDAQGPMTRTEWQARRQRERETELAAHEAKRKAAYERRLAEWEAGRAARERKRKAEAAKAKKPGRDEPKAIIKVLVEDMPPSEYEFGDFDRDSAFDRYDEERYAPWCGASDPSLRFSYGQPEAKVEKPAIDGRAVSWPASYWRTTNEFVSKKGSKYYADVSQTCGRVRMEVPVAGVRDVGVGGVAGGIGGGGARQKIQVWVPSPGLVMWPDGTLAGTYDGHKRYLPETEDADRFCVRVAGVAELVCHAKKTAKTELVEPWQLRD